ncbi:hypothetical protein ACWEKM_40365 [Streptomyces sp. NPDC004752]
MSDAARGLRGRFFTLRRAVHDSPHGVMISTGCPRKVIDCAGRRGLHAVVRPCTACRSPTGAAVRLGPLATAADAAAVGAWLRAGMPGDGTLPGRLRAAPVLRHVAHLN